MEKRYMETERFTIRKKIAKHGNQAIIIVPKILENELKPGMIVDLTFKEVRGDYK